MSEKWYILIVKPRNEIKVSKMLAELDIEVYCPLVKEIRTWSDRKKTVYTPLFKSYVFVRLQDKERQAAFVVPGVTRYLFWLGKPAVVREEEMDALQKWLSNENVEELSLSKLAPGDTMPITKGVLKDNSGIVQQIGKTRVKLILQGSGVVVNLKIRDLIN
tara:strand:+ start:2611 stop:3093 length:483 start_codon:yes stop_codon:yes gene_type:complete